MLASFASLARGEWDVDLERVVVEMIIDGGGEVTST